MRQALRLPTGKRQTIRAFFHAFHQGFGVQAFHRRGVVKQRGRTIGHRVKKVGAHPVKHRHEVVANDLHPVFAQIAQTFLIVLNVLLALRRAELDRLVHVDALDDINIEAVLRRLRLDRSDARLRPHLARRKIVQRPDDAGHARNLADLFEGDGVITFAIPAESGFHVFSSLPFEKNFANLAFIRAQQFKGTGNVGEFESVGMHLRWRHLSLFKQ